MTVTNGLVDHALCRCDEPAVVHCACSQREDCLAVPFMVKIDALAADLGRCRAREAAWKGYADRVSDFLVELTPIVGHIVTSPFLREFDELAKADDEARRAGEGVTGEASGL